MGHLSNLSKVRQPRAQGFQISWLLIFYSERSPYYDLRGANMSNWAENQNAPQHATHTSSPLATPSQPSQPYGIPMIQTLTLEHQQLILDTFCQALTDAEPQVRAKAAESLGRLKIAAALPNLLAQLDDPSPLVRLQVIYALGQISNEHTIHIS
jgi:hypothetical protein